MSIGSGNNRHFTGYTSGDMTYFSNGDSSVHYENMSYSSQGAGYSVQEGNVTYYFDDGGRRLGRSVDHGNGTSTVFDDNGCEIGHCVRNGNITDYFGRCFRF